MRKWIIIPGLLLTFRVMAVGESRRTLFTYENKVPEKGQVEIGALGWYHEVPDERTFVVSGRDEYTAEPYLRYGLTQNLNVIAKFPYKYVDYQVGGEDQGPGDMELGAELVAFQDIFNYPFFIPHVSVYLPTGDEEKRLGQGEVRTTVGASVGTTIYDALHLILDGSYVLYRDDENEAVFGGSIVWDVDEKLALSAEARVSDKKVGTKGNNPVYYLGSMTYRPVENFQFTVYGGGGQHAETDVLAGAKLSYSF